MMGRWAAGIGIFLAGAAAGGWWGARWAPRQPSPSASSRGPAAGDPAAPADPALRSMREEIRGLQAELDRKEALLAQLEGLQAAPSAAQGSAEAPAELKRRIAAALAGFREAVERKEGGGARRRIQELAELGETAFPALAEAVSTATLHEAELDLDLDAEESVFRDPFLHWVIASKETHRSFRMDAVQAVEKRRAAGAEAAILGALRKETDYLLAVFLAETYRGLHKKDPDTTRPVLTWIAGQDAPTAARCGAVCALGGLAAAFPETAAFLAGLEASDPEPQVRLTAKAVRLWRERPVGGFVLLVEPGSEAFESGLRTGDIAEGARSLPVEGDAVRIWRESGSFQAVMRRTGVYWTLFIPRE